jgi:hypothetical protein
VRHLNGHWHGFAIAGCVLVAAPMGFFAYRNVTLERQLTAAARAFTDDDTVWVHCAGLFEEMQHGGLGGWAQIHGPGSGAEARLNGEMCGRVRDWLADGGAGRASDKQLFGLHVLTHEVVHLTGLGDEAATECQALQRVDEMAALLGGPSRRTEDKVFGARYFAEFFVRMPDGYRSPDCRQGGTLDRSPADGTFP